jgi:hypothetical protein
MAGLWQRTGNVTVTNGSKTVTGFGTKWKTGVLPIQKGHSFYGPDGVANEVDNVVSDTEILLVEAYRGGTLANQPYKIDITRTSTISQFAADLASLVGKYRAWFDGMMTWLTGSGDVSILNPDTGATTTLPSWKKVASEGEGQAARAKAEADKAASSAALAGSIVEASALPLPDVWAPLSDSLRMITGYGRDVLVGSDVVARMVNFSRNSTKTYRAKDGTLKTAAVNEPAFEAEGLLLEGQSANIVTNSNAFTPYGTGATKADAQPGPFGANDATRIDTVNPYTGTNPPLSSSLIDGAVYTTSVWLRGAVGGEIIRIGIHNSTTGLGVTLTTEWKRYSITQTRAAGTNPAFVIQAVSAPISFFVFGAQLEALPFASSYIPTNGAAVTRAADQAWLPALGNRFVAGTYAVAFEFDLLGKVPGNALHRLIDFDNSGGSDRQHLSINDANALILTMGSPAVAVSVAGSQVGRAAFRMGNYMASVMFNGIAGNAGAVQGVGSSVNNRIVFMNTNIFNIPTYGHIRNLRMWSKHPISNDQLRTAA